MEEPEEDGEYEPSDMNDDSSPLSDQSNISSEHFQIGDQTD